MMQENKNFSLCVRTDWSTINTRIKDFDERVLKLTINF